MQNEQRIELLKKVRRVVVKIGSGVLKDDDGSLSEETLERLVGDVCALRDGNRLQVILVSSGAVMAGRKKLNLPAGKLTIPQKQAAAAVGQVQLMKLYESAFSKHGGKVAQILITHSDIAYDYERVKNVRNTMDTLLEMGVVPIINENDTVTDEEIKFGDNDTLAAKTASALEMDLLLILSDVDGLYDSDPRLNRDAVVVDYVTDIRAALSYSKGSSSSTGSGGMSAKVNAAKIAIEAGIPTLIVSGKRKGAIGDAMRSGGTLFPPVSGKLSAKKHWIRHAKKHEGRIFLDRGAVNAIMHHGKSLLASGIKSIEENFSEGDGVVMVDGTTPVAYGISNYGSKDLARIMGKKNSEIEKIPDLKMHDEVVNRDNLVIDSFVKSLFYRDEDKE
ncbi:MAG: glutamate 5-kinase [Nitrospinae bacterium]|nr:glutamate 5-kinase [Nitrospinota bacterium]